MIDQSAPELHDLREATSESAEPAREIDMTQLPREVGAMLVSVGVLGVVLPGIAGVPALVVGGLVLWPEGFKRVDHWFRARCPKLHETSMKQVGRYLDDLERRFPNSTVKTESP